MQENVLNSGTAQVLLFSLSLLSSSGQDRVHPGLGGGTNQTKKSSELTGARRYDGYSIGRTGKETKDPLPPSSHSPQTSSLSLLIEGQASGRKAELDSLASRGYFYSFPRQPQPKPKLKPEFINNQGTDNGTKTPHQQGPLPTNAITSK